MALDKVRKAYAILKAPVFVNDSGIYFQKFKDFPGVMSAFVQQSLGFDGIRRLLEDGEEVYWKTTFAYKDADREFVVEGFDRGTIDVKNADKDPDGRAFDRVFVPFGCDRCIAEMCREENIVRDQNSAIYRDLIAKFRDDGVI